MNDPKLKNQIAEKIKDASNILVTVSNDPSVDELSAALGLTLLINKIEKHATAIVSGAIPPAINFLEPDKTFENATDSLRDFIIALDKDKADHLRYKLEGDLVKIYITPYRSVITSDDLEFSQGDYNVELVIALGVENKNHLDKALAAHGKILHDATVVTLTAGEQKSNLGTIDWHDDNASSLCEMLVSLFENMKLDKKMLDKPIATAWLTGLVAATERFSNQRTSSRAMTVAAQLMSAGADQQLIVNELSENQKNNEAATVDQEDVTTISADPTQLSIPKAATEEELAESQEAPAGSSGELAVGHQVEGSLEDISATVVANQLEDSARAAERALEKQQELQAANQPEQPVQSEPAVARGAVNYAPPVNQPSASLIGGTLNATTAQAEIDKQTEEANAKNRVILSHGSKVLATDQTIGSSDYTQSSINSEANLPPVSGAMNFATNPNEEPATNSLNSFNQTTQPINSVPTLAEIDSQNRAPIVASEDARSAVAAAFNGVEGLNIPPPPPPITGDLSSLPLPPLPQAPERLGDILAPENLAGPAANTEITPPPATFANDNDQSYNNPPMQNPNSAPADPGQFQIPGQ